MSGFDADAVDRAFGTGAVKVTPAHDPNDYACGLRNKLPMINILNPDGTINVTFALPRDGGGLAQAVRFHLGPVTSTAVAYSTPASNASAFDYNDPVISAIVVTKLISA